MEETVYACVFAQSVSAIRRVRTGIFANLVFVSRAKSDAVLDWAKGCYQVLWLEPLSTTPKHESKMASGKPDFYLPQESQNEQVKNQDNAHCVFWHQGVVHHEFVLHGVTDNAKLYEKVFKISNERFIASDPRSRVIRNLTMTTRWPTLPSSWPAYGAI